MAKTDYSKITSLNTDAEIQKAIRALNMRVKRTTNSNLSTSSNTLKLVNKFKAEISNQSSRFITQNKFPTSLITETNQFSTNLKKLSSSTKALYAKTVLKYLQSNDLTVPGIKKIIKTKAAKLKITMPQYIERAAFWDLYNDIEDNEKYDSGEVMQVVDIVKDANMSYEEKVKAATDIMKKFNIDPNFKPNIVKRDNNVMSPQEFRNKLKANRTEDLINKYATKKV
jgi:hypothetical protein